MSTFSEEKFYRKHLNAEFNVFSYNRSWYSCVHHKQCDNNLVIWWKRKKECSVTVDVTPVTPSDYPPLMLAQIIYHSQVLTCLSKKNFSGPWITSEGMDWIVMGVLLQRWGTVVWEGLYSIHSGRTFTTFVQHICYFELTLANISRTNVATSPTGKVMCAYDALLML